MMPIALHWLLASNMHHDAQHSRMLRGVYGAAGDSSKTSLRILPGRKVWPGWTLHVRTDLQCALTLLGYGKIHRRDSDLAIAIWHASRPPCNPTSRLLFRLYRQSHVYCLLFTGWICGLGRFHSHLAHSTGPD